ncbi:MAG: flagellar hook-length control protein FliK, partial [Pseudomonadales bacterium]
MTTSSEALKLSPHLLGRLELAVDNLVDAFAASGIEFPQAGSELPPLEQIAQMLDALSGEEAALQAFGSLEAMANLRAALREVVAQVLPSPSPDGLAVPLATGSAAPATASDRTPGGQGANSAAVTGLSPALVGDGERKLLAAQPGLVQALRALLDEVNDGLKKGEFGAGSGFGPAAGRLAQAPGAAIKADASTVPLAGVADDTSLTDGSLVGATRFQKQAAIASAALVTGSAADASRPASSASVASAVTSLQEFVRQAQRSAASLPLAQSAAVSGTLASPTATTVAPGQAVSQPGLLPNALLAPGQPGGNLSRPGFAAAASALLDATGAPLTANQASFLPLAAATQPLAPAPMAATFNTDIALPLLHSQWGQQLAQRIGWLTGQGINSAEIQLNPPELGPMQVRIDTAEQSARVVISVHSTVAREALEAQLPRLRDLFANQGMDLVDVDVNSGEYSERQAGEQAGESMAGHEGETGSAALAGVGDPPGQVH